MPRRTAIISSLFFILLLMWSPIFAANKFTVLSYHDIHDNDGRRVDIMSISTETLIGHFSWLREHGYHVVSLDQILAAQAGEKPLPDQAILLTFDDGYRSIYTRVYPLLKLFNYPAIVAPVGIWMEVDAENTVNYGGIELPRSLLLTWDQIKEMVDSGLVEVASHSHDLHKGVIANPQGNDRPAATTLRYDAKRGRYETDKDYLNRIRADLSKSIDLIKRHTGRKPRSIIWPYGKYNNQVIEIAKSLGMPITMGLREGTNDIGDLSVLRRFLIGHGSDLAHFVWTLRNPGVLRRIRVAHVDLDYLYDEDPKRQEKNLDLLLDRIQKLGVNTVYLQAYADHDGNGSADALYFPNRHLPMRADLFNRVSWQLQSRVGVRVYAWMPVLAFEFPKDHKIGKFTVQKAASLSGPLNLDDYQRLSPFHPEVRKVIGEIYEDLAKNADFSGLLFHDDAFLSDFEDASAWARDHYSREWKLPTSMDAIRESPALLDKWTQLKIAYLIDFTEQLAKRVRRYRPEIKTARNLYASVALNPEAEQWFSQSLDAFLDHYDYTAVMAMPYLEGALDPEAWLIKLANRIAEIPGALDKTVFELQSIDWTTHSKVGSETLARQIDLLKRRSVLNFGYYPDDFIQAYPEISVIKSGLSLNTDPYK